MSDRLKKEFENFEVKPDSKLWKEIEKNIPANSYNIWKVASFITAGVIILSATILFFAPIKNNDISKSDIKNIVSENTLNAINNNNTIIANENQKDNNLIKEIELQRSTPVSSTQTTERKALAIESISKIESLDFKQNNIKVERGIEKPQYIVPSTNNEIQERITSNSVNQTKSSLAEDSLKNRKLLFIPNGFTPNQATNNIFKPAYVDLKSYDLSIFNRNGVLLFNSKDINIGWDGKYRGELCPMGVYVYIIKFENINNHQAVQKGVLNLIR